jgi:hypothetical protein
MECLQNRIDSFSKPVRIQNASKTGATKNVKWSHPATFIATPATLAEAGFYFDPSFDDRDNVTCYFCGKELAGWEEQDDPFDIHWRKCAKTCAFALVRCGLREDLDASGRYVRCIYMSDFSLTFGVDSRSRIRLDYLRLKHWRKQDNNYST